MTLAEDNKDADVSVESVIWRESIIYLQNKNIHSYMKKGLGGR
jgi:hypothetical protein